MCASASAATIGARGTRLGLQLARLAVSSSFWYSKNLIVCGLPSSVTVKSSAVRPSIALPFLSLTVTSSTTSCALAENVATPVDACTCDCTAFGWRRRLRLRMQQRQHERQLP